MTTPLSNETLNTANRTLCETTGDGEIKLTSNQCNSIKPLLQMEIKELKSTASKVSHGAISYLRMADTLQKTINTCTLPDKKTRTEHSYSRDIINMAVSRQMAKACDSLNPPVLEAAWSGARIKNVDAGGDEKVPAAVINNQSVLCVMKDGVCHLKKSKCPVYSGWNKGYGCPTGPYVSPAPIYYR